jgi:D-alanyl-D-alanine carboxypeptidase/D-alanyl-D-alanine-endopeptidase (penicillin-binding protein 4)
MLARSVAVLAVTVSVAVSMGTGTVRADDTPPEPAPVAVAGPVAAAAPTRLSTLLDQRRHDPRLGRDVAYLVTDARTGEVLASRRADDLMQPASNMKIVTAVTALAALGADRRLRTRVVALPSTDGRRHVAVVGAGDPLLSRHGVQELARRTARALGPGPRIVAHPDASLFPTSTLAPGWIPELITGSVGYVRSLGIRGDRSRVPAKNVVRTFAAALRSHGHPASTGPQRKTPTDAGSIVQAPGHTVSDAVAVMLRQSDSSVAEVLFRLVAVSQGLPPTWAGSQQAARQVLAGLGVDAGEARLVDGSGLSKDDRLTARLLVRVLHIARFEQRDRFKTMFRTSAMPVAGRSGTLGIAYGRYTSVPSRCARGDVQAKTGTIYSTIALSGIATTRRSGQRVFSVLVNDRPSRVDRLSTRRAVDGLAATIVGCWR